MSGFRISVQVEWFDVLVNMFVVFRSKRNLKIGIDCLLLIQVY